MLGPGIIKLLVEKPSKMIFDITTWEDWSTQAGFNTLKRKIGFIGIVVGYYISSNNLPYSVDEQTFSVLVMAKVDFFIALI